MLIYGNIFENYYNILTFKYGNIKTNGLPPSSNYEGSQVLAKNMRGWQMDLF